MHSSRMRTDHGSVHLFPYTLWADTPRQIHPPGRRIGIGIGLFPVIGQCKHTFNGPLYNDVYSAVRCPAGKESGGPLNNMCVNCSVGFYKEMESEAPCTRCRDDNTTAAEGTTDPALCNVRKYCSFLLFFHPSLVLSFISSFLHSFVLSFICSFIHSFTSSFPLSFVHSFLHSFIYSLIYLFDRPFIHSSIRSFVLLFICLFVRSFI